jgi:hypothetical protein
MLGVFSKYRLCLPLARLFRSGHCCRFDTLTLCGSVPNVRGSTGLNDVVILCVQKLSAEPYRVRIWNRQQQCPEELYECACDTRKLHLQKKWRRICKRRKRFCSKQTTLVMTTQFTGNPSKIHLCPIHALFLVRTVADPLTLQISLLALFCRLWTFLNRGLCFFK